MDMDIPVSIPEVDSLLMHKLGIIAKNPDDSPDSLKQQVAMLAKAVLQVADQCEFIGKALGTLAENVTLQK